MTRRRIALIGPAHPLRGGIAHYLGELQQTLAREHQVRVFSFSRLYPAWLFPGRSQEDPGGRALEPPAERSLDSMDPRTWWARARELEAWRPDLAVAMWWHPFFGPLVGSVLAGLEGTRAARILICHNVRPHEGSRLDRWLSRRAMARATGYLVHARSDAASLAGEGWPGRIVVHPLPRFRLPDDREVASRDEARALLGVGGRVLLFFGLVRPYKGLATLLEAMPAILARDPATTLLIVGETYGDGEVYRRILETHDLHERVVRVDRYVPDDEVGRYFLAADLVVLPYETASQSAVVQVAHRFGRPVVATRVGGLPEVIDEGRTGILVVPGDPAALAAGIERAGAIPAGTFAQTIRRQEDRFSWVSLARTLLGFLEEEPPRPGPGAGSRDSMNESNLRPR